MNHAWLRDMNLKALKPNNSIQNLDLRVIAEVYIILISFKRLNNSDIKENSSSKAYKNQHYVI